MSDLHAVLVCGSRNWTDRELIRARLVNYPRGTILIHGDCGARDKRTGRAVRGADLLAAEIAEELGLIQVPMPARWTVQGKLAGPIRNKAMVEVLCRLRWCGYRVAVEAFPLPSSKGTWNTVHLSEGVGIRPEVTRPAG
jgi:hypothetical protein